MAMAMDGDGDGASNMDGNSDGDKESNSITKQYCWLQRQQHQDDSPSNTAANMTPRQQTSAW